MSDIWLDPLIRDNALLAISFVFICFNMMRQHLFVIFKDEPKVDISAMKHNNTLARARSLRSVNSKYLMEEAYKNRKMCYTKKEQGVLENPPAAKSAMESMEGQDPTAAMGMMKSQMIFLFSQGAIGYWVNFLFTGFLVGKTPFPLTYRFKSMLQRGVEVENLEPGYISGLCWYFMLMMSVGNIQALLVSLFEGEGRGFDQNTSEDPMMMMMGMQQQAANPLMGGPDMAKMYKQEADALNIHLHESNLGNIEQELWANWKKRGKGKEEL